MFSFVTILQFSCETIYFDVGIRGGFALAVKLVLFSFNSLLNELFVCDLIRNYLICYILVSTFFIYMRVGFNENITRQHSINSFIIATSGLKFYLCN